MSTRKVDLEYLYFHFVDKEKNLSSLLHGGTSKLSDKEVQETYGKHFQEVLTKGDSNKAYDIYKLKTKHGPRLVRLMDSMLKATGTQLESLFSNNGPWIAKQFIDSMVQNYRGVLFIGRLVWGGKRYIGLLKLEWVDTTYAEFDDATKEISIEHLIEKLPAAGGFQKGAIYRHPRRPKHVYMRVFQESVAKYFHEFLSGVPTVSAKTLMADIRNVALSLSGGSLSLEESLDLYTALLDFLNQEQKTIGNDDVTSIVSQTLSSVPKPKIRKKVNDEFTASGRVSAMDVANLQVRFDVGDISLKGSFNSIDSRFTEDGVSKNMHAIEGKIRNFRME